MVHFTIEVILCQGLLELKRICTSYACYYNQKRKRVGHVFQDRFRSENVEDDNYLISVVRYVHNNPVKALICKTAKNYKWSSFELYLSSDKGLLVLPEINEVFNVFSNDVSMAKKKFIEFSSQLSEDIFIDFESENQNENREEPSDYIMGYLSKQNLSFEDLKKRENIAHRTMLIKDLATICGISGRQISELTGINRETVRQIILS